MATKLILNFKVLTPLFLGGADQVPELRAPSFKGLLRFWYRAIDPDFAKRDMGDQKPRREERFFGGTSDYAGQPIFIATDVQRSQEKQLVKIELSTLQPRAGQKTRNGLVYLGFPFHMKNGGGGFIESGQDFELCCVIPRKEREDDDIFRRALLSACWLLGHLGSAGSRNRRGFGSLALTDWRFEGEHRPWQELESLPLLHKAIDTNAWHSGFLQALTTVREWFGAFEQHNPQPHLGKLFTWTLGKQGWPVARWDEALNEMGRCLQNYRLRKQPDYEDVKEYLLAAAGQGGAPLRSAPSRTGFGLPLTFRYPSVRGSVTFAPYDDNLKTTQERQGSLLFLKLVTCGGSLHPLYMRLDGDVPGQNSKVAVRGQGRELAPAKVNALDEFMAELAKES
ncbi:MAG: type III-B CRISPR module RAMP protein Cmr1 [Candidatus Competibacteraceae bacterium]